MSRMTTCRSCKKDVAVCTCTLARTRLVTKKREGHCHKCQLKRGAQVPRGSGAVTCTIGTCALCKAPDSSLVPDIDYNWPKLGKKAIWD